MRMGLKRRTKTFEGCLKVNLAVITCIGFISTVVLIRRLIQHSKYEVILRERAVSNTSQVPLPLALEGGNSSNPYLSADDLAEDIDCNEEASFKDEPLRAKAFHFLSTSQIMARTEDCDTYFNVMKNFGLAPFLESELDFPLAFAHGIHTQPGILELFLSLTFRPMDSHCIHVDVKAPRDVQEAVERIVTCYNRKFKKANVFLATHPVPVFWGHHSVLDIDILCYRQLRESLKPQGRWRMVLNPAGSEMPLRSITSMRQILFSKRENIIPIHRSINPVRHSNRYKLSRYGPGQFHLWNEKVANCPKGPTPYNVTILKGSKNVILTKEFVDFIIDDPISWELYNWLKDTGVPDEHFYSTLATLEITYTAASANRRVFQNMALLQTSEESQQPKGICFRKSFWSEDPCEGRRIHSVCNFATEDLQELKKSICFTANKFNLNVDPVAPLCLYKDIRHRTKLDRWREWKENESARSEQ